MSKLKLTILNNGGNIYYTDTDSIITDIPLDNKLVDKDIGQFKLEFEIKEGYFISSKTYCLLLKDGRTIIKSKGAFSSSLTLNDFINMYKGVNVKAIKQNTIVNYREGSVVIGTKEITLNYNSYTKRDKVYLKDKWIDTKPLYYDTSSSRLKHNKFTNESKTIVKKSKRLFSTISINKKCSHLLTYILNPRYINCLIMYLLSLMVLCILIYICIPYLIHIYIDLFYNYMSEVQGIRSNNLKFILEHKLTYYNNLINNINLPILSNNKLSKFVELKEGLASISKYNSNNYIILNAISNQIDGGSSTNIDTTLNNVTPSPSSASGSITPTYTTLADFLSDARQDSMIVDTNIDINNPLGVQGLSRNIDEVINHTYIKFILKRG